MSSGLPMSERTITEGSHVIGPELCQPCRRVHHGKVLNNRSRVHGELWCYVGEVITERF